MARRILFTAERLRRKVSELQREGYVLRQDSVIAGGVEVFSDSDIATLRELGVDSKWFNHPISRIKMYFYSNSSVKCLSVEPHKSGVGRILLEELSFNKNLFQEDVEYVLQIDDAEEDSYSHLVLDTAPVLSDLLKEYGMLPKSLVLWRIFNTFMGEGYRAGVISGISQETLEEIGENLLFEGFRESSNGAFVCNGSDIWVEVSINNGLTVSYRDKYMGISFENYQMEVSKELGISDFATRYYNERSYRLKLLDGDINDSVFKFDRVNLEDLLTKLHEDRYTLDSLGIVNIRSWADCVTVCGFKNIHDFVYIIFYFDSERKEFLMEIVSSAEEVVKLQVNDTVVTLVHVITDSFKEVSTFVHGFDLANFRKHSLI